MSSAFPKEIALELCKEEAVWFQSSLMLLFYSFSKFSVKYVGKGFSAILNSDIRFFQSILTPLKTEEMSITITNHLSEIKIIIFWIGRG